MVQRRKQIKVGRSLGKLVRKPDEYVLPKLARYLGSGFSGIHSSGIRRVSAARAVFRTTQQYRISCYQWTIVLVRMIKQSATNGKDHALFGATTYVSCRIQRIDSVFDYTLAGNILSKSAIQDIASQAKATGSRTYDLQFLSIIRSGAQ
ncbi:unnamed protein product [Albugo candida]|uniref:Uncharacterized protein n=1 Tax=Albugo candida TaxID=65357 RepID=A0A024GHU1_9STRA|nr:unnamed protein product [Albugo candida]|eukprot:CCI46428.1 unnamed protein product [Albugo candida]